MHTLDHAVGIFHPGHLKTAPVPGGKLPGRWVVFAGIVWLAALGDGFFLLAREEFTPVPATIAVSAFPARSALPLAAGKPTLILFAHPHCPCTRATMHALDALLAEVRGKVAVTVVFTLPRGVPAHWEQGDLWQTAASLPGVRSVIDPDGREAGLFGVRGSGHALLFLPSGQLKFSGGITPSRGHEGESPGRTAIASVVLTGRSPVSRAPVFGCPLLEPPAPSSL